jgi:hypothetical protein
MTPVNASLLEIIPTLTQAQQEAVLTFIKGLKQEEHPREISLKEAYDEFVGEHSELLRLLAK